MLDGLATDLALIKELLNTHYSNIEKEISSESSMLYDTAVRHSFTKISESKPVMY